MADTDDWTVERANAALPWVGAALARIQELVEEARREREVTAGLLEGNGHPATPRGADELRAAVESLTGEGIVLRDLDAGLVDFPARLEDGRGYLLCWVLGEPAVEWWHWPDTGFAGRRPLSDPPGWAGRALSPGRPTPRARRPRIPNSIGGSASSSRSNATGPAADRQGHVSAPAHGVDEHRSHEGETP